MGQDEIAAAQWGSGVASAAFGSAVVAAPFVSVEVGVSLWGALSEMGPVGRLITALLGAPLGAKVAQEAATGGSCPAPAAKGAQVTEQSIREAMKDAPLSSQQTGGVSLPKVQQYVDKLSAGETPPAIKVDGNMIVDGNHRYIAGRIFGQDPPIQPWAGGRPDGAVPWSDIKISPNDW